MTNHNIVDITKNIFGIEVPRPLTKEPYKAPNRKERRKMAAARRRFKKRARA